ncbi:MULTISPECIES: DUF6675 family protein [unclassified Oceanispirochaeta]|uniref:DUF6675 family protein n=1 Tax=unclassified Oceanispirochaeta TaxID=2635722 RepID=UPI0011C02F4C|nr:MULTISPECIES: DUF6675 family protein [unclassified Oceanispirochaeta]MBF9014915.1 hypothetical protein [Oceanispirochaeta sp. M2]NPD71404.1 hypothetical protein [Oceanispirochaeta sp. M1]
MKRTISILLTLMILAVLPLSADSDLLSFDELTSFLSRDDKTTLLNDGELTRFHFSTFDPLLLPPVDLSDDLRKKTLENDLNMGIEGLFLFKDFDVDAYNADPEKVKLKLYNILRSVSTLEGTQYYSASRGEMRDLFVESWMIPDLKSKNKMMDDPIVSTIPASDSIFIHQKDKSFGKHESEMEYIYDSPVIWSVIINQTPMYYKGFLKAINPEKMQIHLLAMPTDEGLLFYGITAADTLNIKAFREKANNSFYNRVKALYAWYISNL